MSAPLRLMLGMIVATFCWSGSALASETSVPRMRSGQAVAALKQMAVTNRPLRNLPISSATTAPAAPLTANQAQLVQSGTDDAAIGRTGRDNVALLIRMGQIGQGSTAAVTQVGRR